MDLLTSDGQTCTVTDTFIEQSHLLADIVASDSSSDLTLSVPISFQVLKWLQCGDWPIDDGPNMLAIAKAADFLHMEKPLDDACRCVAATLRGKTADEVRKFLGM
jgi:hypothetical protein